MSPLYSVRNRPTNPSQIRHSSNHSIRYFRLLPYNNSQMPQPILYVVAGANGSGKTTESTLSGKTLATKIRRAKRI